MIKNANDRKINITEFLDEQGPSNNNNSTTENKIDENSTSETTDQTQTGETSSTDDGFVTVTNTEE